MFNQIKNGMIMKETREAARQWIIDGKPCQRRYGWAWKGGRTEPLSNGEALRMLDENRQWSFGKGFYMLDWRKEGGVDVLEFDKLSEADML